MPSWTNEQLEAINKTGSNIIVSAGAGSGKTAVLTERVITKIKNGISIDSLLILTFTKAAANEMKERIRSAIIKENLSEQLKLLDSAYITTFDSFALSVVKKYHYLINVSPNINIGNENVFMMEKKKILDEIFERLYEERNPKFIKLINEQCVKDDYYIRDLPEDKSITNNVNVRLLDELMESYIYCRKKTEGFSKDVKNVSVNPHLLYWTNTWKNSPFTKEENKLLLSKVNKLKKIHHTDLKTKMLLSSITTALESKIQIQKE